MQGYGETMAEIAAREIESWPTGTPYELRPRMQAITLEIILEHRLRRPRGASGWPSCATPLRDFLDLTTEPPRAAAGAADRARAGRRSMPAFRRRVERVDELIYREIAERRRAEDLEERDDILSMLVAARHEDGSPMSDAEIRDELLTLLVAGHETTATALSWAIERLVRHPEKLERLRDEVEAGEDAYLTATIQETLRLRPVISIVIRKLTEPVELGGYELPAGASRRPLHPPGPPRPGDLPRTRAASCPSASSTTRPAPTPGSPSAAASAAASAPPSPSSRWRSSSRELVKRHEIRPRRPAARAPLPPRDHRDPAPRRRGRPQLVGCEVTCSGRREAESR